MALKNIHDHQYWIKMLRLPKWEIMVIGENLYLVITSMTSEDNVIFKFTGTLEVPLIEKSFPSTGFYNIATSTGELTSETDLGE